MRQPCGALDSKHRWPSCALLATTSQLSDTWFSPGSLLLFNSENVFPHLQVLSVLKAGQVTYSLLKHMNQYIQNLWKTGLLEEKEMFHLDDALQVSGIFDLFFLFPSENELTLWFNFANHNIFANYHSFHLSDGLEEA